MVYLVASVFLFLVFAISTALGAANSRQVKVPGYVGFYYGYLSQVNNISDTSPTVVADALAIFSKFDVLVFSDGLPDDSPDINNTKMIIQQLVNQGKEVYGYVDLGVTDNTTNKSVTQFLSDVDTWIDIGVTGIFWDDVGYDYGVTRDRQVLAFNYTHSQNLSIFANAWDPEDVFDGSNVLLNSQDIYLLESYLTTGKGAYQDIVQWKTKADKCVQYAAQFGVRMATLSYSTVTSDFATTSSQLNFNFFGTAMYNFDLFQVSEMTVSSGDNILYFYPKPSSNYGSTWLTDNVTQTNATHFYRQTDTFTLTLDTDGKTYGIGAMTNGTGVMTNATGATTTVTGAMVNATGVTTTATGAMINATGLTTNATGTTVANQGSVAIGRPENLFVLFLIILNFIVL